MKYLILLFLALTLNSYAQYNGVNIGEGAFGGDGTRYGYDYKYPSNAEILEAKTNGFDLVRVPFKWERVQPTVYGGIDSFHLTELKRISDYAKSIDVKVLLDLHNYARYKGEVFTSSFGAKALGNFWLRFGYQFKDYDNVIFGIMNEPYGVDAKTWAEIQQFTITTLRSKGINNKLYLVGNYWSAAYNFTGMQGDTSNALEIEKIVDPAGNYVVEVHQYFDSNSSGTSFNCVSPDVGVQRITEVTDWARSKGVKLFLGEFGAGRNDTCYEALEKTLSYMKANADVWEGWAYWASMEWFGAGYEFNIHPKAVPNATQLKILQGQCY